VVSVTKRLYVFVPHEAIFRGCPSTCHNRLVKPLDGIKVIEMTSWMAAPSAGAILADMGADVIKVEPPRGDPLRGLSRQPKVAEGEPTIDASFNVDNRGKRSVTVAVDQPDGSELVKQMIAGADVLLTNLLAHRQDRYGLDPETLREVNPRLVHATLTGYGRNGPEATRPGYDVTAFFGRGGVSHSITEPGLAPPRAPTAQGDHTTGLAMVSSILAALRLVERTGEMQVVDVSLLATALWSMASEVAPALIDRRQPRGRDRHNQVNALTNRYPCSDGHWILINMPEGHWWPRFCETVGETAWGTDPEFDTPKKRFDRMPEIVERIDAIISTKTAKEWGQIFDDAGLIWGPIQTLPEIVDDPQARAMGMFVEQEYPDGRGTFDTLAIPIRIEGADIAPRGTAPDLGADTDAVLAELGVSADRIAELRSAGAIGE
jgi:crotonobetainyl-CoA:carnitine CoA-transferase CaiB-like acyl-CoA transferase